MTEYQATNPLNLPIPPNLTEEQISGMDARQILERRSMLRMFVDREKRMDLNLANEEYSRLQQRAKDLGVEL